MPPKNHPKKEPAKRQESVSKAVETSTAALQTTGAATERLVHEAAEAGRRNFEAAAGSAGRAAQNFFGEGGRPAGSWRTVAKQERDVAEQAAGLSAEASARLTHGVQEAAAVVTDLAQESLRRNVETAQSMLRCRTFEDVVRVQSDWMRGSMGLMLSRGTRLSEIAARLALGTLHGFEGLAASRRR